MGRRKKEIGICRICGTHGQLSYEHVPPEKAFNNHKHYYEAKMDELIKRDDGHFGTSFDELYSDRKAKKKQGGIGFNTICSSCNNNTGSWYGSDYVDWVQQSVGILSRTQNKPSLYYPTYFFPLRVIKQVITMFFSINYEGFYKQEPELQQFILDKERRFLNPKFKIYTYYNVEGELRYIGNNVIGNLSDASTIKISELTFPPFGFVLTINSNSPDKRLTDITHFCNFSYNHWTDVYQKFSILPTHLAFFPADYRTKEEIQKGIQESQEYMNKNKK